jgi:hypothetical protein
MASKGSRRKAMTIRSFIVFTPGRPILAQCGRIALGIKCWQVDFGEPITQFGAPTVARGPMVPADGKLAACGKI